MNAKTKAAVVEHGQNLLDVFPGATERDPVALCKKLRRLERKGAALALRLCNGPDFPGGYAEADQIDDAIMAKVDALLDFTGAGLKVFLNRDPRGYALELGDE